MNARNATPTLNIAAVQKKRKTAIRLIVLIAFLPVMFVTTDGIGPDIHEFVEAVGIGLIACGILGRMWCTLFIGGKKTHELVMIGPYSISRNPLYVFSIIASAGVGALTGSLILTFGFAFICYLVFLPVIFKEEKFLRHAFAENYESYCAKVPRLFPKFSLYNTPGEITILPRRLYVTFLDGMIFYVALPVLEAIEWLQDSGIIVPFISLY